MTREKAKDENTHTRTHTTHIDSAHTTGTLFPFFVSESFFIPPFSFFLVLFFFKSPVFRLSYPILQPTPPPLLSPPYFYSVRALYVLVSSMGRGAGREGVNGGVFSRFQKKKDLLLGLFLDSFHHGRRRLVQAQLAFLDLSVVGEDLFYSVGA